MGDVDVGGGGLGTSALGVDSVWMNMVRLDCWAAAMGALRLHCCIRGLCCSGEDVMGDAFWWRQREATLVACGRSDGVARVTARRADREIVGAAIVERFLRMEAKDVWRYATASFGVSALKFWPRRMTTVDALFSEAAGVLIA